MEAPDKVKKAANYLIEQFGGTVDYLGKYEEADAFVFQPNEELCIGYPHVFLLKDGKVEEINDDIALDIIGLLVEDIEII